jgi:hypothetical protein
MKTYRVLVIASRSYIVFSALSLLYVSMMAFFSPQMVMQLVNVELNNNDALSSIRGVYGGVGLTIFISLVYLVIHAIEKGVQFLCLLWGAYAFSRVMTIFLEGPLNDFGSQWLVIESVLFIAGVTLLLFIRSKKGHE